MLEIVIYLIILNVLVLVNHTDRKVVNTSQNFGQNSIYVQSARKMVLCENIWVREV